jgi:hypothetical protein
VAVAPPSAASISSNPIMNFFSLSTPRQKTALDLLSVYVGFRFDNP